MSATRFVNETLSVAVMLSPLAADASPGDAISATRTRGSIVPTALRLGPVVLIASPPDRPGSLPAGDSTPTRPCALGVCGRASAPGVCVAVRARRSADLNAPLVGERHAEPACRLRKMRHGAEPR